MSNVSNMLAKRRLKVIVILAALAIMFVSTLLVTPRSYAAGASWNAIVSEIETILLQALKTYENGDLDKARTGIDNAYFGPFETDEMEQAIRNKIGAKRAFELESGFDKIKELMKAGKGGNEIREQIDHLVAELREDAGTLDRSSRTPVGLFFYSLLIILREGFEAILIISALVAYLIKSGNKDKVGTIYRSSLVAILASFVTALLVRFVFNISGASQEVVEGFTMLLAVVVLFSVSYWLIGKAEAKKWQTYIRGKVESSLTRGSDLALWAAAFLAVYREGAETVLFYRALLSGIEASDVGWIAFGFAAGCMLLAAVFVAFRYGALKIPVKPFFMFTSVLLYYLAFVFAGKGIHELQEGRLVGSSPIEGMPVIGFLGIYPTWETTILQAALLLAAVVGLVYQFLYRKSDKPQGLAREG